MCKELDERKDKNNINLHFKDFCSHLATVNKNLILNASYNELQMQVYSLTGKFLDDKNCKDIVQNLFNTKKNLRHYDILNRSDECYFK